MLFYIERRLGIEKINYNYLSKVSDIIFRSENMSLVIMGPTRGIKNTELKEWIAKFDIIKE